MSRRGTGGSAVIWAQVAVVVFVVALPWCVPHASGGAGKAAVDRLTSDGYQFGGEDLGSGRAAERVRLPAKPSGSGDGGVVGPGGPPLRGGGSGGMVGEGGKGGTEEGGSEGGGGAMGEGRAVVGEGVGGGIGGSGVGVGGGVKGLGAGDASTNAVLTEASSQKVRSVFGEVTGRGTAKPNVDLVWKGERLDFDAPDNLDTDKLIEFSPPMPPASPKRFLTVAQTKTALERIRTNEPDSFESSLAVEAFKIKWAAWLPKSQHIPAEVPLPKNMTIGEVEEIQARLNADGSARGGKLDPALSVVDRMRLREMKDEIAANIAAGIIGVPPPALLVKRRSSHKTAVQLALERITTNMVSVDAAAANQKERPLQSHQAAFTGNSAGVGAGAAGGVVAAPRRPGPKSTTALRGRAIDIIPQG